MMVSDAEIVGGVMPEVPLKSSSLSKAVKGYILV